MIGTLKRDFSLFFDVEISLEVSLGIRRTPKGSLGRERLGTAALAYRSLVAGTSATEISRFPVEGQGAEKKSTFEALRHIRLTQGVLLHSAHCTRSSSLSLHAKNTASKPAAVHLRVKTVEI